MKQKLFTFFLALVASVGAIYASYIEVDGIWYGFNESNKTATVTYRGDDYDSYSNEYSGSVFIPSSVTYNGTTYNVTSIGASAFRNCSSLTSITIPNSVTSIEGAAFKGSTSLTSVTIPESITRIGWYPFSDCSSLTSVVWNAKNCADSDKYYPFHGIGSQITSFTLGENVEYIPAGLCSNMSKLTAITIPNSVTSIGQSAFSYCSSLTSITIPNNVVSIGNRAFDNCSLLSSVVWNAKNAADNEQPFYNIASQITSFTFGDNVEHIPAELCKDMNQLTSITIPNSVISIGESAFYNCSALASVIIPNSVMSIGKSAFYNTEIYNDESNWENSVLYINNCLIKSQNDSQSSYTIKDGTRTIGDNAFHGHSILTSVTIPNGVVSIGNRAFYNCFGLTSITIPNSVTRIGDEAFYGCSSLMSVTIGDKLTNIATSLFRECTSLASLTIGNSVTSIGAGAFRNCSSLTSVTIPNSVTSIGDKAFFDCSRLNNVVLGNSVMIIGERAFCNCSIRSLTIPNSVTSIGDGAFGNNSFTSVTVPSSVTSVGYSIFGGCNRLSSIVWNANTRDYDYSPIGTLNALKSIVFGDSVEYIPAEMCHNSNSIESVTIGKNVKRIGKLAFNNCTGLTQVNYTGDVLGWCQMNFTYINDNPNYYAKNLYINGEKVIDLVIPKSVKTINPYTFYGCSELSSLVIPKSVTSIGADAFGECRKLYDIYCYPTTPPTAEESSFANYNVNLYVPCESLKDYQMDMVFGSFKYIQCLEDLIPSEPQDTTITHTAEMVTICEGEAYKWHGYEYSQSGTYTYTETEETEEYIYHNVYTLELTVLPSKTIEYVIEAEDSYEWHGVVYTESGTYTYRYECTTEILYLTIKDTPDTPDNPIIDTVITGLQYADAYFIADAEYGDYWVFDLYQDYDAYDYVYPAVYVMVNEAYSKNSLNGTYNVLYTEYYTDAESMISTDDEAEDFVGTLTIKHVKGTNYSFNGSFVVDGITYTYDQIVSVFAYEYSAEEETYYELTLSEIDSPDTPDTPERVLSCEEAVALCLETGTTATTEEYTIRGYVTEITTEYSERYNDISFYMADTKDGGQVLFTYRIKPMFETDCAVKVGDFVEAVGPLVNYNGNSPEVYPGVYTIVNEPELPTGTSDIQLPTSNTKKVVKDGQLLILRDGVEYTIMGATVK